jgi:hypothetical protein
MPVVDVHAADDILDEKNNPTAQKFETLIQKADEDRRHSILSTIKGLVDNNEPAEKPAKHKTRGAHKSVKEKRKTTSTKDLPATEQALAAISKERGAERARRKAEEDAEIAQKLVKVRESFSAEFENGRIKTNPHHRLFGSRQQAAASTPAPALPDPVTEAHQADNMNLAQSGSAFSVETLSKLANRPSSSQQAGSDEVTVSLH